MEADSVERRQEELGIHIWTVLLPAFPGRAQSRPEPLEQMELFFFFPRNIC